jgi:signal transduction histidine kinase
MVTLPVPVPVTLLSPPRTGARWILSPISIAVSAPPWIVGIVVNEPAAFLSATAAVQVTIFGTLGYLVMAGVLVLADRLPVVRQLRGVLAYVVIGGIVVAASELRLGVLLAGFELTGLPDTVSLLIRAVGSAFLAVITFGYFGIALSAWAHYRDERNRLLLSVSETIQRAEGHDAAVAAMSAVLRQTVQGRLADARLLIIGELDALASALARGADGRRELKHLHAMTDSRWRAISNEVWNEAQPRQVNAGFREFLWAYARTRPYSVPAVLLGAATLTYFVFGRALSVEQASASFATWLGLATVVAVGTNAVARYLPKLALGTLIASIAILLTFPLWLVLLGIMGADQGELLARTTIVNLQVVSMMIIAGVSPAIARNRDAVLASLRRRRDRTSVHQLQLESKLLSVAQQLAATLHGASRSAFMAEALRLEAALDRDDRAAAIALVEDMRVAILDVEHSIEVPATAIEATDIVALIDNWRSVCAIDVQGSWGEVPLSLLSSVHTVVVEGISDAMRHASCSQIAITVRRTPTGVTVSVTNDGDTLDLATAAGLGTALLDQLAPGAWRRDVDLNGRTQLVVALAEETADKVSR